ncbi:MAG: hypothetical protein A2017_03820 [Lentisphaerae bacterium GWF2_44_16]|nr:MAG: hypothetical protein A2017_03820 [Lentisphaerae bacterium GWF2_44_16]
MKKVFIFQGGWKGHTPAEAADLVAEELRKKNVEVKVEDSLDNLADADFLKGFDLIVPLWTMGQLSPEQTKGLSAAVKSGVGLGGFHGGMGDAFRGNLEYEWMVGGCFLGHPYVGKYNVTLTDIESSITKGMSKTFSYESEQYYMMTDPGNDVLMETIYEYQGRKVKMPVLWTKTWGAGKVFYSALGHTAEELKKNPELLAMTIRGMIWASRKTTDEII